MLSTLILAAGLGTRLDPITRLTAKPAAPLGDHTLIEHVIAWLGRQSVPDVVVNLHYRPETIAAGLGDGAHLGMPVRYSWEQPVLGSAGGPRRALPLLDSDPFLIVNGDTLCDIDLAPMLAAHRESGAAVTMAVIPNPAPGRYNGIVSGDDRVVTGFIPKGHTLASWHFVGVQVVQKSVFAGLRDGVPAETVAGIYRERLLSSPGTVRVWPVSTTFLDIGTPRDYLAAWLARAPAASPGVSASARVTDCAIWPDARIGAHARLTRCIVAGVRVPAGLVAQDAVLIPAALATPADRAHVHDDVAVFPIDGVRG